ncbi:hypothetical protein NIB75_11030 [Bacteroides uniformis]|nr:hypothetical protein [Bacteroides uniformis]
MCILGFIVHNDIADSMFRQFISQRVPRTEVFPLTGKGATATDCAFSATS